MLNWEKLAEIAMRAPLYLLLACAGLGVGALAVLKKLPASLGEIQVADQPNTLLLAYSAVLIAASIVVRAFGQGKKPDTDRKRVDPRKEPESIRARSDVERIRHAAAALLNSNTALVKRDLTVNLAFSPTPDPGILRLDVTCSYRVINTSDEPLRFPVRCQFDCVSDGPVTGNLRVSGQLGEELLVKPLYFQTVSHHESIIRLVEQQITVDGGAWLDVEWDARTKVALPYTEFWATGHPLISMALSVVVPDRTLRVSADCYRDSLHAFDRELRDKTHHFRASGVMLPFQGMLVRIANAPPSTNIQESRQAS
jgi:hypothetical protein